MASDKQKLAIANSMENGGNITQAMRDAGYAETTIHNPDNLTKSRAWEELLEKHIPDTKLAKVLDEGLAATKVNNSHTEPDKIIPDFQTRHKYLETGLKIKNKIVEKIDLEVSSKVISVDE